MLEPYFPEIWTELEHDTEGEKKNPPEKPKPKPEPQLTIEQYDSIVLAKNHAKGNNILLTGTHV